ncbi:MAG: selenocysteine-specific translation elongation factor [Spirochaetes bacterium]|nr:selenocysteine-specific translation elongation factor [Spirochaetota bacterium]
MYVIGTAGHIDHGKTLLIQQLSGIDCDRLPEEKQKGMTIDIGFAHVALPGFETVSIVDVPGHERFIKNMVAGAWGIDLALLVIAVDDGWMAQTEEHFNVLKLLGIERVIPVINKTDLAEPGMIGLVEEEIRERFRDSPYRDYDIVPVSSRTGEGIELLRDIIVKNLRALRKSANTEKPYLYVDRVFASKGYGTVITGTLKNGVFNENDTVMMLPLRKEARIKRIESHRSRQTEGTPSQRTALNLAGISSSEIERGFIIIKNNFFTETRSLLAQLTPLKEGVIKHNAMVTMLAGTASLDAKVILLNGHGEGPGRPLARMQCLRPWFFYSGESFIVTNPGGHRIIAGGTVVLPVFAPSDKKQALSCRETLGGLSRRKLIHFILKMRRWLEMQALQSMFSDDGEGTGRIVQDLARDGAAVVRGTVVIESEYLQDSIRRLSDAVRQHAGLNQKELSDTSGVDLPVVEILISHVLGESGIMEIDGRYFSSEAVTPASLSPQMKDMLQRIHDRGSEGIELSGVTASGDRELVKGLLRSRLAVSLDGNIVYHSSVYLGLRDRIMALFDSADRITIQQARDATGLSRKYLIPLLNRIEDDRLIKRLGDIRIKA